jgi:hypothetical protein
MSIPTLDAFQVIGDSSRRKMLMLRKAKLLFARKANIIPNSYNVYKFKHEKKSHLNYRNKQWFWLACG